MPEATAKREAGLEPGWHEGIPMAQYLSDPAVGASGLLAFHRASTPAHYRHDREADGGDSTASQSLGTAAHDLILEPDSFGDRNVLEPEPPEGYKNPRATKAYKEAVEALQEAHPGCQILTASQWAAAHAMRDNLLAIPKAHELLGADGLVEVTVVWDDPETGLRLRVRPDKAAEVRADGGVYGVCVDLKTTRDASLDGFQKEIDRLGYAFKAAFYRLVLTGAGFPWSDHVCLAVENFGSHQAAPRGIHPDWIDMEEASVRQALRDLADCIAADRWPGYSRDIEYVNAPAWKLKQVHEVDFLTFGSEEAA